MFKTEGIEKKKECFFKRKAKQNKIKQLRLERA